jgi:hypothetical protein
MLNSEMLHFPAILPSGVSGKDAIGELPKKGVRIGEAGKQRPAKAGCRSIVVVRKQDLRKQGFPDDMITAMLKDQAQRIRIPAKKVAECKRIQLMLAHDDDRIVKGNVLSPRVSITEALVIAETVQTEQF